MWQRVKWLFMVIFASASRASYWSLIPSFFSLLSVCLSRYSGDRSEGLPRPHPVHPSWPRAGQLFLCGQTRYGATQINTERHQFLCFVPFFKPETWASKWSSNLVPFSPSVYTSGGGGTGGGGSGNEQDKKKFVSYDVGLGRSPGMTTCTSCQQQVMTNVHYKAGTYAWLMCILFICCGWVSGLSHSLHKAPKKKKRKKGKQICDLYLVKHN